MCLVAFIHPSVRLRLRWRSNVWCVVADISRICLPRRSAVPIGTVGVHITFVLDKSGKGYWSVKLWFCSGSNTSRSAAAGSPCKLLFCNKSDGALGVGIYKNSNSIWIWSSVLSGITYGKCPLPKTGQYMHVSEVNLWFSSIQACMKICQIGPERLVKFAKSISFRDPSNLNIYAYCFIDFIQKENWIWDGRLFEALDDPSRHWSNVCSPMTSDIGLVTNSTQCYPANRKCLVCRWLL